MIRTVIRIIALLGLGLFLFLLVKTNPNLILRTLKKLSWTQILILVALRLLYFFLRTLNWKIVLNAYQQKPSMATLFWARLAAHAVGYVTPTAKIGGEVVRALMVGGRDKKKIAASVVVDKTVELLTAACLTSAGVLVALVTVSMRGSQKRVIIFLLAILIAVIVYIYRKQKKGLFLWLTDGLKRIKLRFGILEKQRENLIETDRLISRFYTEHKSEFLLVYLGYVLLSMLWILEIYLSLVFVGIPNITIVTGFLIVSLGNFAFMLPALPAALGTYELTAMSIFALLGISLPLGLTVILIRRGINLFWTGIGFLPMLKKFSVQDLKG
jgi:uncharacterized protein (TIRG00374 family)